VSTSSVYYYPSTLSYPVVPTSAYSSLDCDSVPVAAVPSAPVASAPAGANGPTAAERRPAVESVPANEPGYTPEPPPSASIGAGNEPTPPASGSTNSPQPPATPAPDSDGASPAVPSDLPGSLGGARNPSGAATGDGDGNTRMVRKPKFDAAAMRTASLARGVLEGRVVSAESGQPESGVRLLFGDHRKRFDDRSITTDALGRYAVSLPEGDWTVKVGMPSGKFYAVSQITVSGGQITDDGGRDVPSLNIKR
jgi:hypothetical protein